MTDKYQDILDAVGEERAEQLIVQDMGSIEAVHDHLVAVGSITTPNGPDLWDKILAQMPPGAVIAGGAVRDYLLGVEPKDIDVFHAQGDLPEPEPLDGLQVFTCHDARWGLGRVDDTWARKEEYEALSDISLVSRGAMFGRTVDLVEMTWNTMNPYVLIQTFDFGINLCYYCEGELYDSIDAKMDRRNKTITLLTNDRRERSLIRFGRFNERMGGAYRLVDCLG